MKPETSSTVTTGRLTWIGHVITCPQCDADDRWTMSTDRPDGVGGEIAWLECSGGHRRQHALVYPDLVRQIAAWTADPPHWEKQALALQRWEPHWIEWSGGAPDTGVPVYRSWKLSNSIDWPTEWPDLIEAFDMRDALAEWAARPDVDTSTSLAWTLHWGNMEPDKRAIELLPARA